jgi:hypothetical protein
MAKKTSDSECLANYKRLVEFFKAKVPDSGRFSVVYGCGVDVGMMNFAVIRKTTYTYSSYAIGYDEKANEIAILPVDREMENSGKPWFLKKAEIEKASYSGISGEITIRDQSLPKKYIQFSVSEYINEDEDNIVICVKQDEEAKKFLAWFKEVWAEQSGGGILQNIFSLFGRK